MCFCHKEPQYVYWPGPHRRPTGGPQIRKSRKMPRDFKSRGSNKIFTQELPKSIPQELSCKHLAHRASSKCMQRPVTKFTWTPEKTCTGSCKVVWGSPGSPLSLRQGAVQHHARTSEWFLPDVYKILARNLSKVMRCQEDFTSIYKDLLIRTCKYKIIQERLRRFPQDQDLSKVFSQGPVQDHARISSRISVGSLRDFLSRIHTRSRRKPPPESHRALYKIMSQSEHHACQGERSDWIWHGESGEMVAWANTKFAPRTRGRDLTPRKCGDGCKSDVKIRIRLKRERSDTHKVPRGLREWNFATTPQWKRFLVDAKCRGPRWLHEHMLDFHHKDCAHHQNWGSKSSDVWPRFKKLEISKVNKDNKV